MSEYIVNLDGELGMVLAVACAGAGFAREEIVRCRDCKHADWLAVVGIGVLHCCYHGWTQTGDPDGFCKWAKRKEMGK